MVYQSSVSSGAVKFAAASPAGYTSTFRVANLNYAGADCGEIDTLVSSFDAKYKAYEKTVADYALKHAANEKTAKEFAEIFAKNKADLEATEKKLVENETKLVAEVEEHNELKWKYAEATKTLNDFKKKEGDLKYAKEGMCSWDIFGLVC